MTLALRVSWVLYTSQEKQFISPVKFNSWYQKLHNLIGWTLTNTSEVTLGLNLSQLQCHSDTYDTTLALMSPTLMLFWSTTFHVSHLSDILHLNHWFFLWRQVWSHNMLLLHVQATINIPCTPQANRIYLSKAWFTIIMALESQASWASWEKVFFNSQNLFLMSIFGQSDSLDAA